jgi:hypothetical protein
MHSCGVKWRGCGKNCELLYGSATRLLTELNRLKIHSSTFVYLLSMFLDGQLLRENEDLRRAVAEFQKIHGLYEHLKMVGLSISICFLYGLCACN